MQGYSQGQEGLWWTAQNTSVINSLPNGLLCSAIIKLFFKGFLYRRFVVIVSMFWGVHVKAVSLETMRIVILVLQHIVKILSFRTVLVQFFLLPQNI